MRHAFITLLEFIARKTVAGLQQRLGNGLGRAPFFNRCSGRRRHTPTLRQWPTETRLKKLWSCENAESQRDSAPKAQGCEERATLGILAENPHIPRRGYDRWAFVIGNW